MKKSLLILGLCSLFIAVNAQKINPVTGSIETHSKKLSKLIHKDAKIEMIADGFQFTEGPLWIEQEMMLLVSDIPANIIYKWTEAKGKEVYVSPGGYTHPEKRGGFMGPNGLSLSKDGKLLVCQHGDRRIAMMDAQLNAPESKFLTVADTYKGMRLNSPNDLLIVANGDLYFTDPSYGFEKGSKDSKKELPYQGVYKMNSSGKVMLLTDSIESPNGIGIFPDGKTMLISNSDDRKKRWYSYDISTDGTLSNGRIFYDASNEIGEGLCDGFKIDAKGNVFATGPGGIWIFNPKGKLLGKIKINGTSVSNCAFSSDGKTIYLTATKYLLRIKMR
ncbi:MAG: hypothetical protein RLZZ172_420 [Bacteroidota bacterium]|jgi:gluconolactonase